MTILFAGNSMAGMIHENLSLAVDTTTTTYFDSTYVSAALGAYTTSAFYTKPLASPISEGWIHFEYYFTGGTGNMDFPFFEIRSGLNTLCYPTITNALFTDLNIAGMASYNNPDYSVPVTQLLRFDIHFKIDNTTGIFRIYENNVLKVEYTGDTLGTYSTFDNVKFSGGDDTNTIYGYYSQIIISDSDTRNMRLSAPALSGAGYTNGFTSGAYTDVDELGKADDTNYLSSAAADQIFAGTLGNVPTGKIPIAVVQNARALSTAGSPDNFNLGLRSGGSNYFSSDKNLDASFGPYTEVWATDPNTSAAWTESGFNALEALVRSRT